MTANEHHNDLVDRGYWLIKDYQPWGRSPTYRNESGEVIFLDRGREMTALDMAIELGPNWIPPSFTDCQIKDKAMRDLVQMVADEANRAYVAYRAIDGKDWIIGDAGMKPLHESYRLEFTVCPVHVYEYK